MKTILLIIGAFGTVVAVAGLTLTVAFMWSAAIKPGPNEDISTMAAAGFATFWIGLAIAALSFLWVADLDG
jgi:hypothetical protein